MTSYFHTTGPVCIDVKTAYTGSAELTPSSKGSEKLLTHNFKCHTHNSVDRHNWHLNFGSGCQLFQISR